MKRLNLRITNEGYKKLLTFAKDNNVTIATAIRHSIEFTLQHNNDDQNNINSSDQIRTKLFNAFKEMQKKNDAEFKIIKSALKIIGEVSPRSTPQIRNLFN